MHLFVNDDHSKVQLTDGQFTDTLDIDSPVYLNLRMGRSTILAYITPGCLLYTSPSPRDA